MTTVIKKEEKNAADDKAKAPLANIEKTIADNVLTRIKEFESSGGLKLPLNYSAANALKFAYLMLVDTETTDKKPVLQVCTQPSIANALLKMCISGLNPMKGQGYFIAYGNKLTWQRSYQGSIAVAKQVGGVAWVNANVIYENDVFQYGLDADTGVRKVFKHEQQFENVDLNKIKGAYAILGFNDGRPPYLEIMTLMQIRLAWQQGFGGGNTKAHKNFTDEMCKKTVINRACKSVINSSDDANLYDEDQPATEAAEEAVTVEIHSNANQTEISMEEPELTAEEKELTPEEKKKAADDELNEIHNKSGEIKGPAF